MTNTQFGFILAVLIGILAAVVAPKMAPQRFAPSYEYRIEDIPDEQFDALMDKHGKGGWDLVFARRASDMKDPDSKPMYECIFKRPL